jgi:hypothetical protein
MSEYAAGQGRLSEAILQEDPNRLMYDDNTSLRVGS